MSAIAGSLASGWVSILDSGADHLRGYYLVNSPLDIFLILGFYILFVYKIGPYLMRNQKPMDLRRTMLIYNIFQIIINITLFTIGTSELIRFRVNLLCYNYETSPDSLLRAQCLYGYFIIKVIDLLDTVFFVLRKKYNQVTFLHTYHHTSMVLSTWSLCKWIPVGHITFVGPINMFVHAVMYFYYFLTAWDPVHKENIWWKKHLTQLQLLQHTVVFTLMLAAIINPSCSYPRWVSGFATLQSALMIYLFANFYVKAYLKKPKTK